MQINPQSTAGDPLLPLSKEEISLLRARAERGEIPSPDELRRFVASTRVSFLAAEARSPTKSRVKGKSPTDADIEEFF